MTISTCVWGVQYPNAGQNIQQLWLWLWKIEDGSTRRWTVGGCNKIFLIHVAVGGSVVLTKLFENKKIIVVTANCPPPDSSIAKAKAIAIKAFNHSLPPTCRSSPLPTCCYCLRCGRWVVTTRSCKNITAQNAK